MPTTPRTQGSSTMGHMHDLTAASWSRIVREPGSTIQFASFDPATATGDTFNTSEFRKLTLNEQLCRPKRVVIETIPDGRCTWRFVPNARREAGVEDEGLWPRVVDVCGELQKLTQDQWDIYKLDPNFDCVVRRAPIHTTVTRSAKAPPVEADIEPTPVVNSLLEDQATRFKRRLSDSIVARRLSGSNSVGQRKKARHPENDGLSSSSSEENGGDEAEEEEVGGMVIDEVLAPMRHQQSERLKKVRANKEEARQKRREWYAKRREKNGLGPADDEEEDDNMMSWTETSPPRPSPQPSGSPFVKRKVDVFNDEGDIFDEESDSATVRFKSYERARGSKRTRTVSPTVTRRAAEMKRTLQRNYRREELERRAKARSQAMHENMMRELYDEAARSQPSSAPTSGSNDIFSDVFSESSSQFSSQSPSQPSYQSTSQFSSHPSSQTSPEKRQQQEPIDEEARRQAALEESKRKIAELEKDRYLWEEQARKRATQEAEEKARAEVASKARESKQTSTSKLEKEREATRRRAAEAEQQARHAAVAEVRTKRKQARETAQRDARNWISRGWTARRALERYIALCDAFDAMNFFKSDVIVFETIPWPVLLRPGSFRVEDIDWTAVETFFRQIRAYLPTAEFRKLVEKSHKRFHPDRWRSRRVLQCVEDEEEKECLEVAANTVAQALTPLWQQVTGR